MTVHDMGPQKATLSPPIENFGSKCVYKLKKSMLMPIANGNKPSTVVMAVSNTGRNRVFPAFTRQAIS